MNNRLGGVVDNLDSAQETMKEKIKELRADISYQNVKIKQFKDDVYSAVQYIQVIDLASYSYINSYINNMQIKASSQKNNFSIFC